MTDSKEVQANILEMTVEIVASHVSNNSVAIGELENLISKVFGALTNLGDTAPLLAMPNRPQPAVPIKKSVMPDHIVCLEDGKKLKMLKRHLRTAYNMTPEQYRERWGRPPDYPMVAPNYARQRRDLAKRIGLGTGRRGKFNLSDQ